MPYKDCLTAEEKQFRQRQIQPRYKAQKDDGWGDNGEVMAFYCFRLWTEVNRLRTLARANNINPGEDTDWFEIPRVGPNTSRPGKLAGSSKR